MSRVRQPYNETNESTVCMQLGVRNACISRLGVVQIILCQSCLMSSISGLVIALRYVHGIFSCEVSMAELVTGLVIHVDCANFVMGKWHNFHQTSQQNSSTLANRNW